ncbi:tRNA (guanine-N(1)-)-methyltransferase [Campylobacter sputorum subsp. bubulus]|uniref:tRNA (Guanine-N(1)-)-methyltransferase n=1 Tax=Campylobacter sputorum subsp. sputorum TaxID=32024 RepID=A0A381DII3_9BACT|nr:outer membrane protein assembly factor BamD [Campylobacter sputorum]ASM35326.1 beta-barrel assembly machinery complex, BamD/YfiO lipoprotein [Campylobacter sputorum aubsp. sputorum RM3237]ASM37007.1 beta-barrel assembly machinery complex, BamD/YfiO lipoprotein [Campylobacter sputorum bv. faecalis CCUG 20703]ASM38688.1 beta-barrel assembly machinery complex, BamD/YfiO lipoprotein [Campylobacter sputorum bv. paraureolyticus LMG 11764]KAB0582929.1 outer membrane protein assembly factor BamD [Ca
MKISYKYIIAILIAFVMTACSTKSDEIYNLSPDAWYSLIIKDIRDRDLESADKHYTSMQSEHVASPLLETILIILAQAHMEDEEYLLANYYLDEYIKKYGDYKKTEYAEFLKMKANFDSFIRPNRNQKLMDDTTAQIQNFLYKYPNSMYRPLAETMLLKFNLATHYLDLQIADLYERTGRDISAEIYKEKINNSPYKDTNLIPPTLPWYRSIFE